MAQSAAHETSNCSIFIILERVERGRRPQNARICLALPCCVFSLSSPAGGEGRGEEAHRQVRLGLPPPRPSPRSCLAGRGRNSAKRQTNTCAKHQPQRVRNLQRFRPVQRAAAGSATTAALHSLSNVRLSYARLRICSTDRSASQPRQLRFPRRHAQSEFLNRQINHRRRVESEHL